MQISTEEKLSSQNSMLAFASCLGVREHSAVYISCPITTGKRLLEWQLIGSQLSKEALEKHLKSREELVTERNIQEAKALVIRARKKFRRLVIDPTQLPNFDSWNQDDFNGFWNRVIRNFVSVLVVSEGWEFSTGSTLEYQVALDCQLTILDHEFKPIRPQDALTKLQAAEKQFNLLLLKNLAINKTIQQISTYLESR